MGWNVNNKYVGEAAREQLAKYSPEASGAPKAPPVPKKEPVYRMEIVELAAFITWLRAMSTNRYTVTSIKLYLSAYERGDATFKDYKGNNNSTKLPEGIYLNKIRMPD